MFYTMIWEDAPIQKQALYLLLVVIELTPPLTRHSYVVVTAKGSVSKTYYTLEKARRIAIEWLSKFGPDIIIYRDGKEFEYFD